MYIKSINGVVIQEYAKSEAQFHNSRPAKGHGPKP